MLEHATVASDCHFARLVEALLPDGGCVVTLVEAYFDESVGSASARYLCVAGYLMRDSHARRLTRLWRQTLTDMELPYFRMSACAHGNDPFDRLCKEERIAVQTRMIEHVKRTTIQGFAVAVDLDDYDRLMPEHPLLGSAYTFCVHIVIGGIQHWIRRTHYDGDVAYFFEAGHESQGEANRIMDEVFRNPILKQSSRYAAHSFVEKIKTPAVQAADLLAWHWYTDLRHKKENKPRRKDFASLLGHPHKPIFIGQDKIALLAQTWGRRPIAGDSLERLYFGDTPG